MNYIIVNSVIKVNDTITFSNSQHKNNENIKIKQNELFIFSSRSVN